MALSISPAPMAVARIVAHKDLEREVLLSIEEFGLFEFIDLRHQVGVLEVKKSSDEEAVVALHQRISNVVSALGLDTGRGTGHRIEFDESDLTNCLKMTNDVLKAVEGEVQDIDHELAVARMDLQAQRNILDVAVSLEPLSISVERLGESEHTFTQAGTIARDSVSKLEWTIREVTDGSFAMRSVAVSKRRAVAVVTVPIETKNAVERIFTALGFDPFVVPEGTEGKPDRIIAQATEKIEELEKKIDLLERRKSLIAKEWGPRILAAWEQMEIEERRINIKNYVVFTRQALKVWGWIPEAKAEKLREILRRRVGDAFELTIQHPDFSEYDAPTYLDNPSFMRPTEEVVAAYGVPSRHDIDPTKIMWLTFPLIFGLIFADVGQGFIVMLIGIIAWNSKRKGVDWGGVLGYLQTGASGLIMMGIFSMIGGLLFGSFFGAETVIEPIWPVFSHTLEDGSTNPYRTVHLLKLAIEVGIVQMTMGILLNLYNRLKHREIRGAVVALAYVWMYLGFVNLLFGVSTTSINPWFDPNRRVALWIPLVGIGHGSGDNGVYPVLPISALNFTILFLFVPLVIMTVASFMGKMDGVVEYLEYSIGMISHTVSYARIFALNIVHLILSGLFMQMVPAIIEIPFPHVSLFGVEIVPAQVWHHGELVQPFLPLGGAIIGTFVVGILEGLAAFMHTLRLHFVEWFSKFYHAGGIPFRPYTVTRRFTSPIAGTGGATPEAAAPVAAATTAST